MQRFLLLLPLLLTAGCAGKHPALELRPAAAASLEAILADLAEHGAGLDALEARRVTLIVQGPGITGQQMMPLSTFYYRNPGHLHIIGRKFGGKTYARITVADNAFLLELPVDRQYFYRNRGQRYSEAASDATPGELVGELFTPEPWPHLKPADLRIIDMAETTATIMLDKEDHYQRVIRVQQVLGRWVLEESTLLQHGSPLAMASYSDYRAEGNRLFPRELEIHFPTEDAFLKFAIGSVSFDPVVPPDVFDIPAQLDTLRRQRYEEREPYAGF